MHNNILMYLITRYPPTWFCHLYGHLQGGTNKNEITDSYTSVRTIPPL